MQLASHSLQITPEQIQIRDIGQLYIRITQNTQFLTNLVRSQSNVTHRPFTFQIPGIELSSFFNLIVQVSYFLYTCYVKKVATMISNRVYVSFPKQGSIQVIMEYVLEKEFVRLDEIRKQQILANFRSVNIFRHENAYLDEILFLIREFLLIIKQYLTTHQNYQQVPPNHLHNLACLQHVYVQLSCQAQKGMKPKSVITYLEETELFYTYSYLLKTLNSSLYDSIRRTGHFDEVLAEVKAIERDWVTVVGDQMGAMGGNGGGNGNGNGERMGGWIDALVGVLAANKAIEIDNTHVSMSKTKSSMALTETSKDNLKFGNSHMSKIGSTSQKCSIWKLLISQKKPKQSPTSPTMSQSEIQTPSILHLQLSPSRQVLSLSLHTSTEVTSQNCDMLMFHCNNMMIELSNISVEIVEKESAKSKKKKRVLAFKSSMPLVAKDHPLVNVLLAIDKAIIIGKVCGPEVLAKMGTVDDIGAMLISTQRINHLTNFFIKKVRRLYETAPENKS